MNAPRGVIPLALVALAGVGCVDLSSEGLHKKNPDFHVIGHRGAPNAQAENTIPAFAAAIALGADSVEIDLCATQDGAVVVWHDRDPDDLVALARQAGAEGLAWYPFVPASGSPFRKPVDELPLADFLAHHGYARLGDTQRDPDATIPLLFDFLDWAADERDLDAIYLDLKIAPDRLDHADLVIDEIDGATAESTDVMIYFLAVDDDLVAHVRDRLAARGREDLRAVRDFESPGALATAEALGLRDVTLGLTPLRTETEFLSEVDALVEARKDKRIDSVIVWTLDSPMQMGVLLYHGVDGIMTNDPAELHELWQLTL